MSETNNSFSINFQALGWDVSLTAVRGPDVPAEDVALKWVDFSGGELPQDWRVFPTTSNEAFNTLNQGYVSRQRYVANLIKSRPEPPQLQFERNLHFHYGITKGIEGSLQNWYNSIAEEPEK